MHVEQVRKIPYAFSGLLRLSFHPTQIQFFIIKYTISQVEHNKQYKNMVNNMVKWKSLEGIVETAGYYSTASDP